MTISRLAPFIALLVFTGTAYAGPVEDLVKKRDVRVKIANQDETWRRMEGGGLRFVDAQSANGGADQFVQHSGGQRAWEPVVLSSAIGGARIECSLGPLAAMSALSATIPAIAVTTGSAQEKTFRPGRPAFANVKLAIRTRDRTIKDWVKASIDGKDARKDITVSIKDGRGATVRQYTLTSALPVAYDIAGFGDASDPVEVVEVRPQQIRITGLPKGSASWYDDTIQGKDGRREVRVAEDAGGGREGRAVSYTSAFIREYSVGPLSANGSEIPETLSFQPGTAPDYLK